MQLSFHTAQGGLETSPGDSTHRAGQQAYPDARAAAPPSLHSGTNTRPPCTPIHRHDPGLQAHATAAPPSTTSLGPITLRIHACSCSGCCSSCGATAPSSPHALLSCCDGSSCARRQPSCYDQQAPRKYNCLNTIYL